MSLEGEKRRQSAKAVGAAQQAKQDAFLRKYMDLLHAVQTGIAWKLAIDHPEVRDINADSNLREHKHLRVGIDGTKSDHGALVKLLIDQGIIDEDDYFSYLLAYLEEEKSRYEQELSQHFGKVITLA